jgi:hypothetical protein
MVGFGKTIAVPAQVSRAIIRRCTDFFERCTIGR